ncbi:MAG: hypothetical protein WB763_05385, partial [Terriglobia bacterium]
ALVSNYFLDYVRGLCNNEGMAKKLPPDIREYFVRKGRQGGKLGGPARAAAMTPEQRSESARKAVLARWAKAKIKKD